MGAGAWKASAWGDGAPESVPIAPRSGGEPIDMSTKRLDAMTIDRHGVKATSGAVDYLRAFLARAAAAFARFFAARSRFSSASMASASSSVGAEPPYDFGSHQEPGGCS